MISKFGDFSDLFPPNDITLGLYEFFSVGVYRMGAWLEFGGVAFRPNQDFTSTVSC